MTIGPGRFYCLGYTIFSEILLDLLDLLQTTLTIVHEVRGRRSRELLEFGDVRVRVRLVEPQCVPDRLCHWMEPLRRKGGCLAGVPCDVAVFRTRMFSLKMRDLHIFRRAITNYTHNRHQKRGGRVPLVEQIEPRKWSIGLNSHDERSFSNKVKPLLFQGISTQVVLFPIFPGSWKSTLFAGPQQPSGNLFAGPLNFSNTVKPL